MTNITNTTSKNHIYYINNNKELSHKLNYGGMY